MDPVRFEELRQRLTGPKPDHQSFRGTPLDISGLTPLELGQLWGAIQRARTDSSHGAAQQAAFAILEHICHQKLTPIFDPKSFLEALQATAEGEIATAVEHLCCLAGEPPAGTVRELRRILGDPAKWAHERYKAYALARLADEATVAELTKRVQENYSSCRYVLQEFEVLKQLAPLAVLAVAGPRFASYYWPGNTDAPDPAEPLSGEAPYIEFSFEALTRARQHAQDIHDEKVPYVADGAFSVDDSHVIARAARVALLRDEPWIGEVLDTLLPQVSVAPTKANSTPCQSLAIALGHSIEGVPTPESVAALREALRVVRHAGLKKKLARNLKPAERALAERPEVALRLTEQDKPGKQHQTMLATCLEAGFWREFSLSQEDWRTRLLDTAIGAPFARSLIWSAQSDAGLPVNFLLEDGKPIRMSDSSGTPVRLDASSRITLWHPLLSDEPERDAWRAVIRARRIRQPVRQAYREHYVPAPDELTKSASSLFAGHQLSIRPLIGLARREGWQVDHFAGLVRRFGEVRVSFKVDTDLYPGLEGECGSLDMSFEIRRGSRWEPIAAGRFHPVVFSEMCRAVDLLVSVTTFALERDPSDNRLGQSRQLTRHNLSDMTRMRANVLAHIFQSQIAAHRVAIDDRHVRVGPIAVHLSTARVTREGAPMEVALPERAPQLAAVPWLPYDEQLLQKIVNTVGVLLQS